MLKNLAVIGLAATLAIGTATSASRPAEARRGVGFGIAAAIIAGTVLGARAYAAPRYRYRYYDSYAPVCYRGPRQCDWSGRTCWHNRWGERVCSGGEWRCWRPTRCD